MENTETWVGAGVMLGKPFPRHENIETLQCTRANDVNPVKPAIICSDCFTAGIKSLTPQKKKWNNFFSDIQEMNRIKIAYVKHI